MYRLLRATHKVAGLVGSLFLILIALTGFLLALKSKISGVRPPTQEGGALASLADAVHPEQAGLAATSLGLVGLTQQAHIDRFEYHASDRIYKILSKENYHEVQVDAASGKVLSVGKRNDQFFEDIHDLSFFHPILRVTVAPVVAIILFVLGVSGVAMYFVPVFRRQKFRRKRIENTV
ncbi:MAG: PepSY domain-containing protein [Chthonomonadaceae bacterium]|nr:PepSY domain-containing protein [Chthonomonadaceae bacterium]